MFRKKKKGRTALCSTHSGVTTFTNREYNLKASKNFTLDWELGQPNRDSRVTNVLVTAELQQHLKTHTPRDSVLLLVSLTCQSGPLER